MNTKKLIIIGVIIAAGGLAVFAYVVRPSAEASAPIEAIPLIEEAPVISDPLPTADGSHDEGLQEDPIIEPTDNSVMVVGKNSESLEIFTIDQSQSFVSFSIDEILRGDPVTAVGVTNQVAGEIGIDFENSANIVLGNIQVNARTIATDNNFRNRAIANEILDTGIYEFIKFVPTELIGLPLIVELGVTYEIQVVGDLTIRNITNSAIWEMTITILSEDQISGFGSIIVVRSDYDLRIPEVSSVANVSQDVLLEIEFIANK